MNRIKLHVRKGDNVEVIAGNFKGSSGKVLEVIARKERVLIEGVRMIKKHLKKSQDNPQGKIAEREGPIHISNVRVLERGERAAAKGKGSKKKAAKEKPVKSKASKDKEANEEQA
jgi:large subunit ribosomal protein L24